MSYVITSSTQDRYAKASFGIEQPFQYTNYLGNAYEIPPNSKVALESIKFVRLPVFVIKDDETNLGYYNFGIEGGGGKPTIDDGTGLPLEFQLAPGQYTVTQLADGLQIALRESQYHPEDKPAVVGVNYAVNGAFEGFKYTFDQTPNSANTSVPTTMMWAINDIGTPGSSAVAQITYTTNGSGVKIITGPEAPTGPPPPVPRQGTVMFPEYPMSLNGGECVFDITDTGEYQAAGVAPLGIKPKGGWIIGLSRPQRVTQTVPTNDNNNIQFGVPNNGYPSYYNQNGLPNGASGQTAALYDYAVRLEPQKETDGFLKVSCVVSYVDTAGLEARSVEVNYWTIANTAFTGLTGPYNFSLNKDGGGTDNGSGSPAVKNISQIKFLANGEQMEIHALADVWNSGTSKYVNGWTFIVDYTNAAITVPPINLSPIMATNWALFPKISMYPVNSTLTQTKEIIKFINFSAVTTSNSYTYWNSSYWSDFVFGSRMGQHTLYKDVDLRVYNRLGTQDLQDTTTGIGGNEYITDYVSQFIYNKNNDWTPAAYTSPNPNIMKLMGYKADADGYVSIADGTQTEAKIIYDSPNDSANIPTASADSSLFVRCPTLTQTSQNFGKGSMSKIIYHCPQFSNSGTDIGALFFQPAERVYIDLNNKETLNLNEITIEIVDRNEELAYELTGNTTVCLHII